MRDIRFEKDTWNDVLWMLGNEPKLAKKLFALIDIAIKSPYAGIGKPEPLKGDLKGYWSRRVNQEHRLVYKVDDAKITVVGVKGHYKIK